MLLRVDLENREEAMLATTACLSKNSQGRQSAEEECDFRTIFQRDRDRIIHSKAFRRLKHKTQVFIAPAGDHYRTRLTHTLEVAQIARTIARALALNEDLTEAIALGHDLGHTPFGHAGEEALSAVSKKKFAHNEHSLRIVDYIEGLNLSYEVRDGILNHTGAQIPATLEGQIVRITDRIAYINHDIDDALRAGIIGERDLPPKAIALLGKKHAQRINKMVRDIIKQSWEQPEIRRSKEIAAATGDLRDFLFKEVYIGSRAKEEEEKAQRLIQELYKYFYHNPTAISAQFKYEEGQFNKEQLIIDYIAGMSDRYAINVGKRLFLPMPWVDKRE